MLRVDRCRVGESVTILLPPLWDVFAAFNFFEHKWILLPAGSSRIATLTVIQGSFRSLPSRSQAAWALKALLDSQAHAILAHDPELAGISVLFPEQVPFAALIHVTSALTSPAMSDITPVRL